MSQPAVPRHIGRYPDTHWLPLHHITLFLRKGTTWKHSASQFIGNIDL